MSVPIGTIVAYAGSAEAGSGPDQEIGDGFLLCAGQEVSEDKYPELSLVILSFWGDAREARKVKLPDLRGLFLRGVDMGAGRDPDAGRRTPISAGGAPADHVGSFQLGDFAAHDHQTARNKIAGEFQLGTQSDRYSGGGADAFGAGGDLRTGFTGGQETRPINAYVNYLIKAR